MKNLTSSDLAARVTELAQANPMEAFVVATILLVSVCYKLRDF
jgi:hypothetical protein